MLKKSFLKISWLVIVAVIAINKAECTVHQMEDHNVAELDLLCNADAGIMGAAETVRMVLASGRNTDGIRVRELCEELICGERSEVKYAMILMQEIGGNKGKIGTCTLFWLYNAFRLWGDRRSGDFLNSLTQRQDILAINDLDVLFRLGRHLWKGEYDVSSCPSAVAVLKDAAGKSSKGDQSGWLLLFSLLGRHNPKALQMEISLATPNASPEDAYQQALICLSQADPVRQEEAWRLAKSSAGNGYEPALFMMANAETIGLFNTAQLRELPSLMDARVSGDLDGVERLFAEFGILYVESEKTWIRPTFEESWPEVGDPGGLLVWLACQVKVLDPKTPRSSIIERLREVARTEDMDPAERALITMIEQATNILASSIRLRYKKEVELSVEDYINYMAMGPNEKDSMSWADEQMVNAGFCNTMAFLMKANLVVVDGRCPGFCGDILHRYDYTGSAKRVGKVYLVLHQDYSYSLWHDLARSEVLESFVGQELGEDLEEGDMLQIGNDTQLLEHLGVPPINQYLQIQDVATDGDCGFHAINPDYQDGVDSRAWATGLLIQHLCEQVDWAINQLIAQEIFDHMVADDFSDGMAFESFAKGGNGWEGRFRELLRNLWTPRASEIDRTLNGETEQALTDDTEILMGYVRFIREASRDIVSNWLQFSTMDGDGTNRHGIADAVAYALRSHLIVVDGRPPGRGTILHFYEHPEPIADPIFVVQINPIHYAKGIPVAAM